MSPWQLLRAQQSSRAALGYQLQHGAAGTVHYSTAPAPPAGPCDFTGSPSSEKQTMQQLNTRLASYLQQVELLEATNQRLEHEIQEEQRKRCPSEVRELDQLLKSASFLQDQITDCLSARAQLNLQLLSAELAVFDLNARSEQERQQRSRIESENSDLRCLHEVLTVHKLPELQEVLRGQSQELQELQRRHLQDEQALLNQASGAVSVTIQTAGSSELIQQLDMLRRISAESWAEVCSVQEPMPQAPDVTYDLDESPEVAELEHLWRTSTLLTEDLQHLQMENAMLEASGQQQTENFVMELTVLQETADRLCLDLDSVLQAAAQQAADHEVLLDVKSRLETEIQDYMRLLDSSSHQGASVLHLNSKPAASCFTVGRGNVAVNTLAAVRGGTMRTNQVQMFSSPAGNNVRPKKTAIISSNAANQSYSFQAALSRTGWESKNLTNQQNSSSVQSQAKESYKQADVRTSGPQTSSTLLSDTKPSQTLDPQSKQNSNEQTVSHKEPKLIKRFDLLTHESTSNTDKHSAADIKKETVISASIKSFSNASNNNLRQGNSQESETPQEMISVETRDALSSSQGPAVTDATEGKANLADSVQQNGGHSESHTESVERLKVEVRRVEVIDESREVKVDPPEANTVSAPQVNFKTSTTVTASGTSSSVPQSLQNDHTKVVASAGSVQTSAQSLVKSEESISETVKTIPAGDKETVKIPAEEDKETVKTILAEEDKKTVEKFPAEEDKKTLKTILVKEDKETVEKFPAEEDKKTVKTILAEEDKENVEKIPAEEDKETVKTIPAEEDKETVEKVPAEKDKKTVKTILVEEDKETVEKVPAEEDKESVKTILVEEDKENVEKIPAEEDKESVKTILVEEDKETVKKIPAEEDKKTVKTVVVEEDKENVEKIPAEEDKKTVKTVVVEEDKENVEKIPAEEDKESVKTILVEEDKETVEKTPAEEDKKTVKTVVVEEDKENVEKIPAEEDKDTVKTIQVKEDKENVEKIPAEEDKKTVKTIVVEEDKQTVEKVPAEEDKKTVKTVVVEEDKENVEKIPAEEDKETVKTVVVEEDKENVEKIPAEEDKEIVKTILVEEDKETVRNIPAEEDKDTVKTIQVKEDKETVEKTPAEEDKKTVKTILVEEDKETVEKVPAEEDKETVKTIVVEEDKENVVKSSAEEDKETVKTILAEEDKETVEKSSAEEDKESVKTILVEEDKETVKKIPAEEDKKTVKTVVVEEDKETVEKTPAEEDKKTVKTILVEEDKETVEKVPAEEDKETVKTILVEEDKETVEKSSAEEDKETVKTIQVKEDKETVDSSEQTMLINMKESKMSSSTSDSGVILNPAESPADAHTETDNKDVERQVKREEEETGSDLMDQSEQSPAVNEEKLFENEDTPVGSDSKENQSAGPDSVKVKMEKEEQSGDSGNRFADSAESDKELVALPAQEESTGLASNSDSGVTSSFSSKEDNLSPKEAAISENQAVSVETSLSPADALTSLNDPDENVMIMDQPKDLEDDDDDACLTEASALVRPVEKYILSTKDEDNIAPEADKGTNTAEEDKFKVFEESKMTPNVSKRPVSEEISLKKASSGGVLESGGSNIQKIIAEKEKQLGFEGLYRRPVRTAGEEYKSEGDIAARAGVPAGRIPTGRAGDVTAGGVRKGSGEWIIYGGNLRQTNEITSEGSPLSTSQPRPGRFGSGEWIVYGGDPQRKSSLDGVGTSANQGNDESVSKFGTSAPETGRFGRRSSGGSDEWLVYGGRVGHKSNEGLTQAQSAEHLQPMSPPETGRFARRSSSDWIVYGGTGGRLSGSDNSRRPDWNDNPTAAMQLSMSPPGSVGSAPHFSMSPPGSVGSAPHLSMSPPGSVGFPHQLPLSPPGSVGSAPHFSMSPPGSVGSAPHLSMSPPGSVGFPHQLPLSPPGSVGSAPHLSMSPPGSVGFPHQHPLSPPGSTRFGGGSGEWRVYGGSGRLSGPPSSERRVTSPPGSYTAGGPRVGNAGSRLSSGGAVKRSSSLGSSSRLHSPAGNQRIGGSVDTKPVYSSTGGHRSSSAGPGQPGQPGGASKRAQSPSGKSFNSSPRVPGGWLHSAAAAAHRTGSTGSGSRGSTGGSGSDRISGVTGGRVSGSSGSGRVNSTGGRVITSSDRPIRSTGSGSGSHKERISVCKMAALLMSAAGRERRKDKQKKKQQQQQQATAASPLVQRWLTTGVGVTSHDAENADDIMNL